MRTKKGIHIFLAVMISLIMGTALEFIPYSTLTETDAPSPVLYPAGSNEEDLRDSHKNQPEVFELKGISCTLLQLENPISLTQSSCSGYQIPCFKQKALILRC